MSALVADDENFHQVNLNDCLRSELAKVDHHLFSNCSSLPERSTFTLTFFAFHFPKNYYYLYQSFCTGDITPPSGRETSFKISTCNQTENKFPSEKMVCFLLMEGIKKSPTVLSELNEVLH